MGSAQAPVGLAEKCILQDRFWEKAVLASTTVTIAIWRSKRIRDARQKGRSVPIAKIRDPDRIHNEQEDDWAEKPTSVPPAVGERTLAIAIAPIMSQDTRLLKWLIIFRSAIIPPK